MGLLWTKYSADQIPPVESTSQRLRLQLEKVELRPPYDIAQVFTMAVPVVEQLAAETGETVHLSEYSKRGLISVHVIESVKANRVSVQLGEVLPMHAARLRQHHHPVSAAGHLGGRCGEDRRSAGCGVGGRCRRLANRE